MNTNLPKVLYQDSDKQAVVDDWRAFIRDRLAPLPVVCSGCNGVVQVETERHLFGRPRYAMRDGEPAEQALVEQAVREVAGALVTEKFWNEVFERPQDRMYLRGDNRVHAAIAAEQAEMLKYGDAQLNRVAETALHRMRKKADGADLFTYCPNCETYIPVDLPDFMRTDVKHELARRVATAHELDYIWRKPENILPPAPMPKAEPEWIGGQPKPERTETDWQLKMLLTGIAIVAAPFIIAMLLRILGALV